MAVAKTINLNLSKPDEDEFYSIDVQNTNMDKLDDLGGMIKRAGTLPNRDTNIQSEGTGKVKINGMNLIDIIYPIGTIYTSAVNQSPETVFGGTWTQIKDTFLLTAGDTYRAGDTGGEARHILTASELTQHSHSISINSGNQNALHSHTGTSSTADINHIHGGSTSADGEHTHPITVKMGDLQSGTNKDRACAPASQTNTWAGAATAAGTHAHSFSTGWMNTNNVHNHSITTGNESAYHIHPVNGTSGSAGSGAAHNNMPPYLVVYAWKRVS